MLKSYGFLCDCDMCREPTGRKLCPPCVSQQGSAGGGVSVFLGARGGNRLCPCCVEPAAMAAPCIICDHLAPAEHTARLERARAAGDASRDLREVVAVSGEGLLHESHHLLFSWLTSSRKTCQMRRRRPCLWRVAVSVGLIWTRFGPAVTAMKHCCRLMDMALPPSMEKAIYYIWGNWPCAPGTSTWRDNASAAHQMSCSASGQRSPLSSSCWLWLRTLPLHGRNSERTSEDDDDDDDDDEMEY